jgi:C4-dicarboxylate-binding protein DctP
MFGIGLSRLSISAVWIFAFAFATFPASAEATRNLRITLQLPISNHLGQNLVSFKNKLEAKSSGRLTVEIFDRAQLYKDFEVIDAVSDGRIEMGVVALNQYRKKVPVVDLMGLPFMFNLSALLNKSTEPDSEIRREIDQRIRENTKTVPLWWQPYGTSVVFSKGPLPIKSPDHIAGKNVRVISDAEGEFIRMCGGKPFRIPGSQQMQALKDGKVELGLTGVSGVRSRSLWEVSDTITKTNHGAIEFLVIMNADLWAGLSEADRALISGIGREVEAELREKFAGIEEAAYAFAREKNMKIVEIAPNDLAEWRACSVEMVDQFLQRSGEAGFDLMAAYGRLRLDPCCNAGLSGTFTKH